MVTRSVKIYEYEIYVVDIETKANSTIIYTDVKNYRDELKLFKAVYATSGISENIRLVTLLKTRTRVKRYGLPLDKFLEQAEVLGETENEDDEDNKEENK